VSSLLLLSGTVCSTRNQGDHHVIRDIISMMYYFVGVSSAKQDWWEVKPQLTLSSRSRRHLCVRCLCMFV